MKAAKRPCRDPSRTRTRDCGSRIALSGACCLLSMIAGPAISACDPIDAVQPSTPATALDTRADADPARDRAHAPGPVTREDGSPLTMVDAHGQIVDSLGTGGQIFWQLAWSPTNDPQRARPLAWSDVHLQRFVVRLPDGRQQTIASGDRLDDRPIGFTTSQSGVAVSALCVDDARTNPHAKLRQIYCAKQIIELGNGDASSATALVTGKFGEPVELRPLASPLGAPLGADMPVVVYVDLEKHSGQSVQIHRPDGSVQTVQTRPGGLIDVHLDQYGAWRIRHASPSAGRHYVGELLFETKARGAQQ